MPQPERTIPALIRPLDAASRCLGMFVICFSLLCSGLTGIAAEKVLLLDGSILIGNSQSVENGNVLWRTQTGEDVRIPINQIVRIDAEELTGSTNLPARSAPQNSSQQNTSPPPDIKMPSSEKPIFSSSAKALNNSPENSLLKGMNTEPTTPPLMQKDPLLEIQNPLVEVIDLTPPEEAFGHDAIEETWTESVPLLGSSVNAISSVLSTAQHTATAATNQASLWTNRIQLGGNFTNGNSNIDIIDVLAQFERSTKVSLRQMDVGGQWAQTTGNVTANRWWLNGNFDWPFSSEEDRWITFLSTKNEYNQLANLNIRSTNTTGLGYRFYYEPKKRLITRIGPAVTVEAFDSPDNTRTTFDLFSEVELRWPIAKRTSLESRIRYQPGLLDGAIYRVFSTSSIMWDLDEENRWKLALNLRTEYVSVPSPGRKSTDWFTVVSLVYQRK